MTMRLGAVNEFCWMDLKARDVPAAAAFFSAVLGWRFAVDEKDWRRATKISASGFPIGSVSDLAGPLYPPDIPAHIAYYLAVDDVDRRAEKAAANGARLVLAPSDAGDQGRIATLLDPFGAAFSLWQPRGFRGWDLPAAPVVHGPHRMVLACADPREAALFYRETLDATPAFTDFVPPHESDSAAPQWELALVSDDLAAVAARVREHGRGSFTWSEHRGLPLLRVSGPEGLTFRIRAAAG
ncbi:VOC family protein [Actinocorallia populi]|uniref:VOC family protein n=1 Tax=Actinocorallia populi TaxID=2079200 RepID=UPI000D08A1F8|nr:VOC family protein [Actinocorallia populi]